MTILLTGTEIFTGRFGSGVTRAQLEPTKHHWHDPLTHRKVPKPKEKARKLVSNPPILKFSVREYWKIILQFLICKYTQMITTLRVY